MIDLANRTIRHGVVGFQYQIAQNVFNRDTNGINSYQRSVRMEGAALRLRTRTLLIGISGILRLLGMNSTGNKFCLLCKAAHRLGKKDENCAKAQRKKWTFAGDCHGCFPISWLQPCQLPHRIGERCYRRDRRCQDRAGFRRDPGNTDHVYHRPQREDRRKACRLCAEGNF